MSFILRVVEYTKSQTIFLDNFEENNGKFVQVPKDCFVFSKAAWGHLFSTIAISSSRKEELLAIAELHGWTVIIRIVEEN